MWKLKLGKLKARYTYSIFKYEELATYERDCVVTSVTCVRFVGRSRGRRSLRRLLWIVRLPWIVLPRVVRVMRSRITRVLGLHIGIPRPIGSGVSGTFGRAIGVVVIRASRVFVTRIVMAAVIRIVSFGVSVGNAWGVPSVRILFGMSVMMAIVIRNVWSSSGGSRGSGGGCC